MYSDSNSVFNCIQRAHQNFLENYTQFQVLLLLGGIHYPRLGAAAGLVWLLGRIVYTIGYSTGDPQKRMRGGFQYVGLLFLLYSSVHFGVGLLGWI
ncbi:microsomal glutathione S-transferase 3-like [Limulus polyphemus]|uniref:Microsomal glutathione S-transferase 3-like n=1 Tax=Limulus polyphemus TaxID=6850 RepID=A0ABM1S103_LIMPO|nr:microsomal glutathione S-transferase 3-like [Limulus polyphemus]